MSRYRRPNGQFRCEMDLVKARVEAALRLVNLVCPRLNARRKRHLVNQVLTICDGKDRTPPKKQISQRILEELIWPQVQCLAQQRGRCPMLLFTEPLSRAINEFFNEEE